MLAAEVGYGGNPEHKRNPGDFGLEPPAKPRSDKGLCDDVGMFRRAEASALLKEAARRGIVSRARGPGEGFPKQIWAMTPNGWAIEAMLENPEAGTYHGYPLHPDDPFASDLALLWKQRDRSSKRGAGPR